MLNSDKKLGFTASSKENPAKPVGVEDIDLAQPSTWNKLTDPKERAREREMLIIDFGIH